MHLIDTHKTNYEVSGSSYNNKNNTISTNAKTAEISDSCILTLRSVNSEDDKSKNIVDSCMLTLRSVKMENNENKSIVKIESELEAQYKSEKNEENVINKGIEGITQNLTTKNNDLEIEGFTQQIMDRLTKKSKSADKKEIQSYVKKALNEIHTTNDSNTNGEAVAIYIQGENEYRARITQSKKRERKLIILKRRMIDAAVAEGRFGKILKFEKVHSVGFRAVKQAKEATDTSIKDEFQIQSYIGKLTNVQKPAKNLINNFGSSEYEGHFYKEGDVEHFIDNLKQRNALTPNELKNYIKMIITGIHELHKKGIGHFDIKGDNLLVDNGEFFVADLGGAKNVLKDTNRRGISTPLYSLNTDYIRIQSTKDDSLMTLQGKRDVYSAGLVAFQLATRINKNELNNFISQMISYDIVEYNNRDVGITIKNATEFMNRFQGKLKAANVDEDNTKKILLMLNPDIDARPTSAFLASAP